MLPPTAERLTKLLDRSPYITAVAGDDGVVRFVSEQVRELLGYDPDDIVGTSFFDYLDLEWNPRTAASIVYAVAHPGQLLPMVMRVRHRDGSWVHCEVVAHNSLDDPDLEGLVIQVRRYDERLLLDRVLETMAEGGDLRTTLSLAVQLIASHTLDAEGAIAYHPVADGFESAVTTAGLPDLLACGPHEHPASGRDRPWKDVLNDGQARVVDLDRIPEPWRSAARARGAVSCWVTPVPTASSARLAEAVVIVWRTKPEDPEPAHEVAMDLLVRLASVALERAHQEARLNFAARHDALTGLPNRHQFFSRLERELERAHIDTPGRPAVAVLYLDLDGFKPVNDTLGHFAGDEVLAETARRIEATVRPGDLTARLGGDEFCVVCPDICDVAQAEAVADRLLEALARPIRVPRPGVDATVTVGASIGVAVALGSDDAEAVLDAADRALLRAKADGKGRRVTAAR
jgi:diguanylate cyclase (GGDEF)-like protein/PAS domain S-box-containing protein